MSFENTPELDIGSAWQRPKSSSISTVLAITNLSLRKELQEKFPPQVVFTTSTGAVLSQDIPTFLKTREFVGTDNHVLLHMTRAIDGPLEEDEDAEDDQDIDAIDLDADSSIEDPFLKGLATASMGDGEDADEGEDTIPVFEPAIFDGLDLDDHFISYSEAPGAGGDTIHILRFALDETLNLDQIKGAFDATSDSTPTIEEFVVDSSAERTNVNISGYMPVFLEVDSEGNGVAAVYVTSVGDFRAAQAAAELESAILNLRDQEVLDVKAKEEEEAVTVIPQVTVQPVALQVTTS